MALRGFREANDALKSLNQTLEDRVAQRTAEVARINAQLRALLETAPAAIMMTDPDLVVVWLNSAAARFFQEVGKDDPIGRSLTDIFPAVQGHLPGLEETQFIYRSDDASHYYDVHCHRVMIDSEKLGTLVLAVDVTAIRRVQDDLRRTIATLQRSNDNLEEFAYVASHDLQEPLRMVSVYMQLLVKCCNNQLDEEAQRYVRFAIDGSRKIKKLIDDLLAYSRIEIRGESAKWWPSADIVATAIEPLAHTMAAANVQLVYGDLPHIWADGRQIEQVFYNLIDNAVKFRREASSIITISWQRIGDTIEFVIADNGIGFTQGQSIRIFQLFQRLHEPINYPGNGIGLAVAKRIIERHGGHIWATSQLEIGSKFYFTLPAEPTLIANLQSMTGRSDHV